MFLTRLRPALYGASLLVLVVAGRMLFAGPSHPSAIEILRALLAAGAAGAAAGLVYEFLGRQLITVPRVGPYIWGIACVGAYMLALIVIAPLAFGTSLISGGLSILLYLGLVLLFGFLMGLGYAQAERGVSFYALSQTNWRFLTVLIVVAAALLVVMKVAHWW